MVCVVPAPYGVLTIHGSSIGLSGLPQRVAASTSPHFTRIQRLPVSRLELFQQIADMLVVFWMKLLAVVFRIKHRMLHDRCRQLLDEASIWTCELENDGVIVDLVDAHQLVKLTT